MDLDQYRKALLATPKELRLASKEALNKMGLELRDKAIAQIMSTMTVRNQSYVRKVMRVEFTKAVWIEQQKVTVGSTKFGNVTGWAEQEDGSEAKRDRTMALFSRGGSQGSQVKKANRLNQGVQTASDVGIVGTEGNRTFGLLAYLARASYKGLIRLDGGTFKGTIARITKGRTKLLKTGTYIPMFKTVQRTRKFTPKRNEWMKHSLKAYMGSYDARKAWDNAVREAMKHVKAAHPS